MHQNNFDVIIIGGGLAGLTSSILLSRAGLSVLLLERSSYPFHKVCGEYVSNEILHFLQQLGFNPFDYGAASINKLRISDPAGKSIYINLEQGGFGLSRLVMDEALAGLARHSGVDLLEERKVNEVAFENNRFYVTTAEGIYSADFVIGSYGKRDGLDKKFKRDFIFSRSGYLGVKYHIRTDYPFNEVALDNFRNGYCGIVKIEKDLYNLCYLYKKSNADDFSSLKELESKILYRNPVLRRIFEESEFVFESPVAINQISFARKSITENHVLMCGDSAGLISPLCGNGMSMAVHSAKILSELLIITARQGSPDLKKRMELESAYQAKWNATFKKRLIAGRIIQNIFCQTVLTGLFLKTVDIFRPLEKRLVAMTHGKPI